MAKSTMIIRIPESKRDQVENIPLIDVKYEGEDLGYCRNYYRRVSNGVLLCLQQDWNNQPPNLYVCSQDGEPDYKVLADLNVIS